MSDFGTDKARTPLADTERARAGAASPRPPPPRSAGRSPARAPESRGGSLALRRQRLTALFGAEQSFGRPSVRTPPRSNTLIEQVVFEAVYEKYSKEMLSGFSGGLAAAPKPVALRAFEARLSPTNLPPTSARLPHFPADPLSRPRGPRGSGGQALVSAGVLESDGSAERGHCTKAFARYLVIVRRIPRIRPQIPPPCPRSAPCLLTDCPCPGGNRRAKADGRMLQEALERNGDAPTGLRAMVRAI